uniref:Uncharacterized protein n=1 Tax=Rhizophora mucronata TaxID=61149 RepID=A0A2P2Q5B1_RHIMU
MHLACNETGLRPRKHNSQHGIICYKQ